MRTKTYSRTNGIVGVSLLALFAIAIIAGQARGNLHDMNSIDSDLPTAIDLGVLVESAAPVAEASFAKPCPVKGFCRRNAHFDKLFGDAFFGIGQITKVGEL